jgi:hypothetical protein
MEMNDEVLLEVTSEHYGEFIQSVVWLDIKAFFQDCLEINRDLLEGIRGWQEGRTPEPDDALRGRNWQIRDMIAYVEERAMV